jgi:hypothetical protein
MGIVSVEKVSPRILAAVKRSVPPGGGRASAGWSWEIYADPSADPAKLETTIAYLLR